jgi:hypothetical protein
MTAERVAEPQLIATHWARHIADPAQEAHQ